MIRATRPIRLWPILFTIALMWIAFLLQRGHPLHWDEIEFFRATRWIGEGKAPYAGFWEHHVPLQWIVFAVFARWFGEGPGTASIVLLRWLQVPFWIGTFALLVAICRRVARETWGGQTAMAMLLASSIFVRSAIEYRVDTLGNFLFISMVALLMTRDLTRLRAVTFGVLGACAVLTNMRLAPLVVLVGVIAFVWRPSEDRWRWNARAFWMACGIALVAGLFVGWLHLVHAWPAFLDQVVGDNRVSNATVRAGVKILLMQLLEPARSFDPALFAASIGALAGAGLALRSLRRPSAAFIIALLFVASILVLVPLGVHYAYHLQTTYLLMPLLAAVAADRLVRDGKRAGFVRGFSGGIVIVALLSQFARLTSPAFGAEMAYQDLVMRTVDERTTKSDVVWDGVGYALRREPAYRYWFLPTFVRLMGERGFIEPYDIERDPPAAIVHGLRVNQWMRSFPSVGRYAVHHYLPLFRDLWIPGMSATLEARPMRLRWRVPASGRYAVIVSEPLASHPWFSRPLDYAMAQGPIAASFEIPLEALPRVPDSALTWTIDGQRQLPGARTLDLKKGSTLDVSSSLPRRAGVLVVPYDVHTLCAGPEQPVFF